MLWRLLPWGRDFDGHQESNSTTTSTQATDVNSTGSSFIKGNSDWVSVDSDGSLRIINWSKTDGTSICPVGFRVPSITELRAELLDADSAQIANRTDAFNSFLALSSAGYRDYFGGSTVDVGSWGYMWSSSASGSYASLLYFGSGIADWSSRGDRAYGQSVRCLRD